jgi:hypothetical protein
MIKEMLSSVIGLGKHLSLTESRSEDASLPHFAALR